MPRRNLLAAPLEPEELAKLARLRYIADQSSGFTRRRNGQGFVYFNGRGAALRDPRKLRRIESLVIPPAWREVWICPVGNGHLQATGRDARRRKQYIYHQRWQHVANLAKFARLEQFGKLLPKLRRQLEEQLSGRGLTQARVLAGMVALLDLTGVRIGNEEYVKENDSYGLTTLRNRHVTIGPKGAELRFRAKGGVRRTVLVEDKRLVRIIAACAELKGAHLFQAIDNAGRVRPIESADVNEYLQQLAGQPITAKDFRTWKGSSHAAGLLYAARREMVMGRRKRLVRETVCAAAELLSNTPAVCRSYYIHPGLLASYEDGTFDEYFTGFAPRRLKNFSHDEQILARFLSHWKP